jgi:integrase
VLGIGAARGGKLLIRPHIPMLEENNVRKGFFEREDFERLRDAMPTEVAAVAAFAYLTGWRVPSEILTLQWHQVDFAAGIVRLEPGTTKNNEARVFPFGVLPELNELLENQRALTTAHERKTGQIVPWVFHRHGRPIRSFRGAWTNACTAAGCPGRIPHDFRRTAVRNLVRAGGPERIAMMLTGHKTRSVFERYNIASEADLRSGVEKLAGTITGTVTRSGAVLKMAVNEKRQQKRSAGGGNRTRTPLRAWDFKS